MQQIAVIGQGGVRRRGAPLLGRFIAKLVDVLPTALASLIGGFLFTQYQAGYRPAPQPAAEQAAPASAEMLQLVRDEHAMIFDYIKAQTAAEKSRNAAEDKEDARAVAEAKPAAAPVTRRPLVAAAPAVSRIKVSAVAATPAPAVHAPRVIAQVEQTAAGAPESRRRTPPATRLAARQDPHHQGQRRPRDAACGFRDRGNSKLDCVARRSPRRCEHTFCEPTGQHFLTTLRGRAFCLRRRRLMSGKPRRTAIRFQLTAAFGLARRCELAGSLRPVHAGTGTGAAVEAFPGAAVPEHRMRAFTACLGGGDAFRRQLQSGMGLSCPSTEFHSHGAHRRGRSGRGRHRGRRCRLLLGRSSGGGGIRRRTYPGAARGFRRIPHGVASSFRPRSAGTSGSRRCARPVRRCFHRRTPPR